MFTGITILTYIGNVKCNVQNLNDRKFPAKAFGLVTIKIPQKHYYTTLAIILYVTKPTNTMIKTAIKHYNKLISVITEDLRWLNITTDTGMKLKFETTVK